MEPLAITLLVIAAVFMALKQGLTDVPQIGDRVGFLRPRGWWNYVPLALMVFAGIAWLVQPSSERSVVSADPEQPNAIDWATLGDNPIILPRSVSLAYQKLMEGDPTQLQEKKFLSRYAGKRIALELSVFAVMPYEDEIYVQLTTESNESVFVSFDPKWEEHLATKKPGDPISFHALIQQAASGDFKFVNAVPI